MAKKQEVFMIRFLLSLFVLFQIACFSAPFSYAYVTDSLGEVYRLKINQEDISDVQMEKILTASQADIAGNVTVSAGSSPLGKHLFIGTARDQTTTIQVYDATGNFVSPVSSIEVGNISLSSLQLSQNNTQLFINRAISSGINSQTVKIDLRKIYSISASGDITFLRDTNPNVLYKTPLVATDHVITIGFSQAKQGLAKVRKENQTSSFQTNLNVTSVVMPVGVPGRLARSMLNYLNLSTPKGHRHQKAYINDIDNDIEDEDEENIDDLLE